MVVLSLSLALCTQLLADSQPPTAAAFNFSRVLGLSRFSVRRNLIHLTYLAAAVGFDQQPRRWIYLVLKPIMFFGAGWLCALVAAGIAVSVSAQQRWLICTIFGAVTSLRKLIKSTSRISGIYQSLPQPFAKPQPDSD